MEKVNISLAKSKSTLESPLLESAEAAATFLGSKGRLDGSKLEVQGSKGDKISATSIKGKKGLPRSVFRGFSAAGRN